MSELTPCPECQRHVRKTETRCPFCGEAVSLAHLPSPALPRRRLGRAATFAFGASVVGATAFVGCSDGSDVGAPVAVYGAPPAGASTGGSFGGGLLYGSPPSGGTFDEGGTTAGPVYGAPAAGAGNEDSGGNGGAPAADGGAGGTPSTDGGALAIYGGPPSGAGGI